MQLEELFDYKNMLMKDLCSDKRIVELVTGNPEADVPNHGLPYTQIYPYEYIPETVNDGQTFICFDVDILRVPNKTIYEPVIYIWAVTHKSRLRVETKLGGGVLLDELAKAINSKLNGSRYYGLGELTLGNSSRFKPITDYLGRALVYYAKDFNRPKGRIDAPSNRKPNRYE